MVPAGTASVAGDGVASCGGITTGAGTGLGAAGLGGLMIGAGGTVSVSLAENIRCQTP